MFAAASYGAPTAVETAEVGTKRVGGKSITYVKYGGAILASFKDNDVFINPAVATRATNPEALKATIEAAPVDPFTGTKMAGLAAIARDLGISIDYLKSVLGGLVGLKTYVPTNAELSSLELNASRSGTQFSTRGAASVLAGFGGAGAGAGGAAAPSSFAGVFGPGSGGGDAVFDETRIPYGAADNATDATKLYHLADFTSFLYFLRCVVPNLPNVGDPSKFNTLFFNIDEVKVSSMLLGGSRKIQHGGYKYDRGEAKTAMNAGELQSYLRGVTKGHPNKPGTRTKKPLQEIQKNLRSMNESAAAAGAGPFVYNAAAASVSGASFRTAAEPSLLAPYPSLASAASVTNAGGVSVGPMPSAGENLGGVVPPPDGAALPVPTGSTLEAGGVVTVTIPVLNQQPPDVVLPAGAPMPMAAAAAPRGGPPAVPTIVSVRVPLGTILENARQPLITAFAQFDNWVDHGNGIITTKLNEFVSSDWYRTSLSKGIQAVAVGAATATVGAGIAFAARPSDMGNFFLSLINIMFVGKIDLAAKGIGTIMRTIINFITWLFYNKTDMLSKILNSLGGVGEATQITNLLSDGLSALLQFIPGAQNFLAAYGVTAGAGYAAVAFNVLLGVYIIYKLHQKFAFLSPFSKLAKTAFNYSMRSGNLISEMFAEVTRDSVLARDSLAGVTLSPSFVRARELSGKLMRGIKTGGGFMIRGTGNGVCYLSKGIFNGLAYCYRGIRHIHTSSPRDPKHIPNSLPDARHDVAENTYVAHVGDLGAAGANMGGQAAAQVISNVSGIIPTIVGRVLSVFSGGGAGPAPPPPSFGGAGAGAGAAAGAASMYRPTPAEMAAAAGTGLGFAPLPAAPEEDDTNMSKRAGGAAGGLGGGRRRRRSRTKTHKRKNHKRRAHRTKRHPKRR